MRTPAWLSFGNIINHGLGGVFKLGGIAPGENDDEVVSVGQFKNDAQSNLFMQNTQFPEGKTGTVPLGYNAIAYGEYTVNGTLTVDGEFRVVDWPE